MVSTHTKGSWNMIFYFTVILAKKKKGVAELKNKIEI